MSRKLNKLARELATAEVYVIYSGRRESEGDFEPN